MRRSIFVLIMALTALAVAPSAQNADPKSPIAFEAASVKPNKSGDNSTSVGPQPGGRFVATNAPFALLVTLAYQLQPFQLQGAPGWARTDRFDIVAKLEGDPPTVPVFGSTQTDPRMLALRTLLADRFKLAVHWETQDLPIYALVLARADGKLGPNIHPSVVDCAAVAAARAAAAREGGATTPAPGDRVICGMRNNAGHFQFGGNPMSFFANGLANQVARVVVDRTDLTGNWDFELTFTPERIRQAPPGAPPSDIDPNGPSIFTAIQEQLGLKLESTKGPVQVLVIDRVEQPSPD
jgi:bla regulator protein blaR1